MTAEPLHGYAASRQAHCGGLLNSVEVYDPASNSWSRAPVMPTAREWAGGSSLSRTALNSLDK